MAGLLAPYIPDSGEWFKSAAQGYALGDTMRNRDLSVQAGGQAAEGDLAGAKSTLYAGGNFEGGNQVNQMMRQASDDALKKTEKFHATLGNLAMTADTPEKWGAAIKAAQGAGLDVSKYTDFSARDMVLAQSGKTLEAIGLENDRRKAEVAARKLLEVEPGKTLVDPVTQKPVFTAPPADRAQYEFTKYGVGNKFSGEVKPYAGGNADPELTLEQSKHEQALRKEYTALSGDMRTINDSVGKLRKAKTLDTGAGDIAMVYAYMKMLDPTSVVREGEYATAEQTGGVPERVVNAYNKVIAGTRLTPSMREQFVTAGEALAGEKTERFGKLKGQYENIARKAGADPSRIMLDEGMVKDTGQLPADPNARNSPSYSAAVPPEALKMLKGNPTPQTMQQFDEIFGQGAAAKALGR
ncbi:MAG TPA: hypothetical protein VK652_13585 [Steroidobacteraceae bacterium]|nr:hypothetical protein [Steroidobacteraceae bacterium]